MKELRLEVMWNFALVWYLMVMGRWSEERAVVVVQVVLEWRLSEMVVMSGEVGCWFGLFESLVGWSRLRMAWLEEVRAFSMVSPLWSVVGEGTREGSVS